MDIVCDCVLPSQSGAGISPERLLFQILLVADLMAKYVLLVGILLSAAYQ